MQATQHAAARPASPGARKVRVPKSFEEALKLGWHITSENTALSTDERERRGKVVMAMKGHASRLVIAYTATKAGFQFGSPRLIQ